MIHKEQVSKRFYEIKEHERILAGQYGLSEKRYVYLMFLSMEFELKEFDFMNLCTVYTICLLGVSTSEVLKYYFRTYTNLMR